jgi:hypothetical protein
MKLWVSYQIPKIIKKSLPNWLTHAFNTSKKKTKFNHTFVFGACGIISTTMHGKLHTKINKMIILIFSQIGTNDTQHTYTHPHIHIKTHTIIFIYTHT